VPDLSRLRYADRLRLTEEGSLGDLSHDDVPTGLRNAVAHLVADLAESSVYRHDYPSHQTYERLRLELAQHFGLAKPPSDAGAWFRSAGLLEFLDGLEIVVELERLTWTLADGSTRQPLAGVEARLQRLCIRHRFGYQVENGRMRRVGSPALDVRVVGPALIAVSRPGWEQVERTFREALQHQRGGPEERDDSLTAATAALEAALKAAGLKGDRLSALAKSLRNSDLVPGQLKEVPEALDTLLKRSGAIRDPFSDAHGKPPDAVEVPEELVDLTIYWTGAFINYLAAAADRRS
jgi:hypothetical protein